MVLECTLTKRPEEFMGLLVGSVPLGRSWQGDLIQREFAGEKKTILRLEALLPSSSRKNSAAALSATDHQSSGARISRKPEGRECCLSMQGKDN